jgi:hypothetical protein
LRNSSAWTARPGRPGHDRIGPASHRTAGFRTKPAPTERQETHDYIGINPNNNATAQDANGNTIYQGIGVSDMTIRSENLGTASGNVLSNDIASANSFNGIILSGTAKNVVRGTIIGSDNTVAAVVDDPGNALGNG